MVANNAVAMVQSMNDVSDSLLSTCLLCIFFVQFCSLLV